MNITPFSGSAFWFITAFFLFSAILLQWFNAPVRLKNITFIGFSLFVVFNVLSYQPLILLTLLMLLSLSVYAAGKILTGNQANHSKKYLVGGIVFLATAFLAYFKYSIIQSSINNIFSNFLAPFATIQPNHIFFIGVSYFSFKFIHFIVECYKKNIRDLNFLTFINYTFFFPSFFSGPINRYNNFSKSVNSPSQITNNTIYGGKRIINGLFKKIVLGDSLFQYSIAAIDLNAANGTDIILAVYAYMFYIYFNFAGYTDMAIGCGRIAGIELPENFNYPFLKRNLQQFWANWHMSLTTWLTDYIYWPLARKFRNITLLRKKPIMTSNICIIITFLVCGVWHGDGLNFIIWGAYHGIGLAILNGYTFFIKRHTNKKIKRFVHKSPIAYGISNFITFQYVAFGFLLFGCNTEKLTLVAARFF